jgi:TolA-binding protein
LRKTIRAFSTDPIAARALVALPQVYAEGLRDRDSAERLYREAQRRFPGSEAAVYAGDKLTAL